MGQAVLRVESLPEAALDAASVFHADWLAKVREALAAIDSLALVFPAATYDHRGWRLAVVQNLAREVAPRRVNGIAGADESAIAGAIDWLAQAPGITGQLLAVD
jgi:hypothetical protein